MFAALLSLVLLPQPGPIQRDAYGVPLITASTEEDAFYWFGRAVAEDRLWQMELSRRLARAKLAEVMGRRALASDRDVVKTGYTDEELQRQIDAMPERVRDAFQNYARGVNDTIDARKQGGTLPDGYASLGFEPTEWTPLDSAAIAVHLLRQFGRGGAGELRNYALYLYLKAQPLGESVLDVLDDLAWQNDPRSVPTVRPEEDPLARRHPRFPAVSRRQTERHIASLPRTSLLELMPAIRMAAGTESHLMAEQIGAPTKFGSYAVVVGPDRSKTGYPLLLSAPQMGHGDPSVLHEVAIVSPGLKVAGIDVPGVPAVIVGYTPNLAWGLTSGGADIEDVFFSRLADDDTYLYGEEARPLIRIERTIRVKGSDPVTVEAVRTHHGPVVLTSRAGNAVFSVQSSFWNRELGGIVALFDLYGARDSGDVERFIAKIPVTFNFF
ncbi:MAG: penicillin acylase family protein, partial [Armatimonadetes bacterium]|nr:penicillin acylase family protein [Armatimonadota bacterium]